MSETRAENKKPYEKPELKIIEMKEEEVLAVGCKTVGPNSNVGQSGCGILNGCNQTGS